jgi:uncharacterized repeat protein (TIGR01451 family)
MQGIKNLFKTPKLGAAASIAMVAVLAVGFFLVPQKTNLRTLAENCVNPPVVATLNYWPVTFSNPAEPCKDFPALDAKVDGSQFSSSQADLDNGIDLPANGVGVALMYIHNGAATNLDPNQTTARNVRVTSNLELAASSTHTLSSTFAANNTNTVSRTFRVNTPANTRLEIVPNSGKLFDYQGNLLRDNLSVGNNTYTIGDMLSCFEHSVFLSFRFRAVTEITPPAQNPTLTITKDVRNLTQGGSYADSVTARQNDRVQYQIRVRNNGPVTATNVTLNDYGTSGTSFESGSLTVDGSARSGDVSSVSLGDMTSGREIVLTYTSSVYASSGSYTNTARARASNATEVSDTATVSVQTTVPPTQNPTLSITKDVRNLTQGGGYAQSVNARQNDRVQYQVRVRNNGGSGTAQNVFVTDFGTSGTSFESGSLTVDGSSRSGSPSSISLGDLSSGREVTITYTSSVYASSGSYTNTATAQSSNTPSVSDTATVYVSTVTNTDARLQIIKSVRNDSQGTGFQNSVSAQQNDRVTFEITVTNVGNTTVSNVRMSDFVPSGLNVDFGSIRLDGSSISSVSDVFLGSMSVNQSRRITFTATVNSSNTTIVNVATARGDNATEVRDDATVTVGSIYVPPVNPGNPNITQSKRAFNDTKNADATTVPAAREDYIRFTLTTTNTGNADSLNYVITDDLSQVLPFADLVDNGGGSLNGNTLQFPARTIRAGETVTTTFRVRAKAFLNAEQSFVIRNTYGNTVTINIPGNIVFVAPRTGVDGVSATAFAGFLVMGFAAVMKRKALLSLLLA